MEIKVGEYVRINKDFRIIGIGIGKVVNKNKDTIYVKMSNDLPISFNIDSIIKHSFNIIDLIEVGDYVNGEYVTDTWNGNRIETHRSNFHEDNIKSIVTKQAFESIKYEV